MVYAHQKEIEIIELQAVDILVVEDDENDAELALRALKKDHIHSNVIWIKDGAAALDFLFCTGEYANRPLCLPRLILLDLKLPKMDGIEVLTRIKSDARTKAIPVVMVTSSANERDIVESYRVGANSYIVKPVDFKEFIEVVSRAGLYWAVLNQTPVSAVH